MFYLIMWPEETRVVRLVPCLQGKVLWEKTNSTHYTSLFTLLLVNSIHFCID